MGVIKELTCGYANKWTLYISKTYSLRQNGASGLLENPEQGDARISGENTTRGYTNNNKSSLKFDQKSKTYSLRQNGASGLL